MAPVVGRKSIYANGRVRVQLDNTLILPLNALRAGKFSQLHKVVDTKGAENIQNNGKSL